MTLRKGAAISPRRQPREHPADMDDNQAFLLKKIRLLDSRIRQMEQENQAILNSTFWRLTAPLRSAVISIRSNRARRANRANVPRSAATPPIPSPAAPTPPGSLAHPIERIDYTGRPIGHLAVSVHAALQSAVNRQLSLPESLLDIEGMSGRKYRAFINQLVRNVHNARYLEIGSWAGSTLCSAIYVNDVEATAIDNWSEFGGPLDSFFRNLGDHVSAQTRVNVINADFRSVDYGRIGKFNIYLFDGPHGRDDHKDALLLARPALDPSVIFIVDDWNWADIRTGTYEAIAALGAKIDYSASIYTTPDGAHPADHGLPVNQMSDWHNGYFVAVLSLPDRS